MPRSFLETKHCVVPITIICNGAGNENRTRSTMFLFLNETNIIITDNVRYCNDKTQNSTNFVFPAIPILYIKEKRRKAPVIPVL